MELWVLFGTFLGLLVLGTPVAFCLGIASLATVLYMGMPPFIVFQRLNSGINAFALMAIPFFVYAGDLMVRGGIAGKLVRLAAALVGHLRGGLGQVNIVASTLFGGVSGSAVADASAVGGLMIPQMRERGYAIEVGEHVFGLASVALPIVSPNGQVRYAVGLTGPEQRMLGEHFEKNLAALHAACEALTRLIALPNT